MAHRLIAAPRLRRRNHLPPRKLGACGSLVGYFLSTYNATAQLIAALLQAVPALIGAFVGAPVLARELETGTFRYAWTQGFGRRRWTLAKLVPLAVTVTAAAGAFSLLFSWYYQPFFADRMQVPQVPQVPLSPAVFDLRGVAFAAWTLAAFAIGALAGRAHPPRGPRDRRHPGRLHRARPRSRDVPAPALHDAAAHRNLVNPPGSAWIISQWWTKGGQPAQPVRAQPGPPGGTTAAPEKAGSRSPPT